MSAAATLVACSSGHEEDPFPCLTRTRAGLQPPQGERVCPVNWIAILGVRCQRCYREREEQYDRWLENMRVIETLREYVRGRLDRKEYVEDEEARRQSMADAMDIDPKSPRGPARELGTPREGSSLYPILRMPGA
ncbi:hypothetical protein NM208_g16055 [Fusarium decemcellulare]|uniref:Uncharacterized protein n=1 Tax=Fusarium decemcellulare TaxID=57161 RepID=A0ACC1RD57_9HYPO|nr:hypothetical protein NM208_g16055 [Fusarium decemcellulare]